MREKQDLFNEMTRIIHRKDAVISQSQKRNSELENYVNNLEKLNHNGVQAEYKLKPVLESQDKISIMHNDTIFDKS